MSADTTLCACGHPRHRHEYLSPEYPAICGHADPIAADQQDVGDPFERVCMCLDFESFEPSVDARKEHP